MFNYCIIGILVRLLERRKVTAKELADEFEISERTVYRYLDTLEGGGIPLTRTLGKNGGISISDNYSIMANLLTEDEKDYMFTLLAKQNDIKSKGITNKLNLTKK